MNNALWKVNINGERTCLFTDVKQVYLPYGYDVNEIAFDKKIIILKNDGKLLNANGEVLTDSVVAIHKGNYIVKDTGVFLLYNSTENVKPVISFAGGQNVQ